MTQSIPIGPAVVLSQNVIYALPAKPVSVTTSAACETSLDKTTWTSLSSGSNTSAVFIRCTTTSPTVTCKNPTVSGGGNLPTNPTFDVVTANRVVFATNGNEGTPSLTWANGMQTGLYMPVNDNIGITVQSVLLSKFQGGLGISCGGSMGMFPGGGAVDTMFLRTGASVVAVTDIVGTVVGKVNAAAYQVAGVQGADFGPASATSITVRKGIITAIS